MAKTRQLVETLFRGDKQLEPMYHVMYMRLSCSSVKVHPEGTQTNQALLPPKVYLPECRRSRLWQPRSLSFCFALLCSAVFCAAPSCWIQYRYFIPA